MEKRKFSVLLVMTLLVLANIGFFPIGTYAAGQEVYVVAADSNGRSNYILSYGNGTFSNQQYMGQIPQPYYTYGCGIGDFDKDGDFDYVIGTGFYDIDAHHIYLYEKLGPGNDFASPVSVDTWTEGYYPMDLAVADYNNDGNMDFVLTHYGSSNSELYLGYGDFTFTRSVLTDTSPYYSIGADSEDFDNDGNPDFVAAQYGSPAIEDLPYNGTNPYYIYVNLGNGNGTFATTSLQAASGAWGITAADFDSDGNADIISGGLSTAGWYFYKGNGNGTFQSGVAIAGVTSYNSPIDNYDFDDDDDQDIIIGYQLSALYYSGNGDGTFSYVTTIGGGSGGYRYAISAPSARVPGVPYAIASPERQCLPLEGGTANFNGTASYDEDGWIVSYDWDFGDGSPHGTAAVVSHVYSAETEETMYRVRLTVTDNDTRTDVDTVVVKIGNTPPKVTCVPWTYELPDPHQTWNGNPTVLKAKVEDMDLPLTYTWDFGDNTSESGTIRSEWQKNMIEATHLYPNSTDGTLFTATLTVWDPCGASGLDEYYVEVKTKTLEVEIDVAIDDGLWWLAGQQNADGSWGESDTVARTGFAVLKFETHAIGVGEDPLDPSYYYHDQVRKGLDYIFSRAFNISISMQSAGDPDTDGDGIGVYLVDGIDPGHRTYETGIAMMAIAASTHPEMTVMVPGSAVNGWTYLQILQDAVDYLAWGQTDSGYGRGGWDYMEKNNASGRSDNSNAGYAVLGLGYAEAPAPYGFNLTVPVFVMRELNIWIDYIQNDVDGDTNDGGSGYSDPNYWVNILKTGNLLYEMALVGDNATTPRVANATDYIERHWNDPNWDPGWRGSPGGVADYQATYTTMKGFESLGIDTITVDSTVVNWFEEMATKIVAEQNPDGSWPAANWGDSMLATEWAMLTLQKAVPPPRLITKTLNATEGELGDVVLVRLEVTVPKTLTAEVVDTLPSEWSYINGTFTVNDVLATPIITKTPTKPKSTIISYTVTEPGTHVIEFDCKVDSAYWEDREVCNVATATWYDEASEIIDEREAKAYFIIRAFEELSKSVSIPYVYLYLNEFTPIWTDWTTVGTSPYLDAIEDGNYIEETEHCQMLGVFGFENITLGDCTISSVTLEGYTDGPYDETCDFDVYGRIPGVTGWEWLGSLYATGSPAWVTPRWLEGLGPDVDSIDDIVPETLTEAGLNDLEVVVHFWTEDGLPRPPGQIDCLRLKVEFDPLTIKEKTETQWTFVIEVHNPFPYTMQNVMIKDNFGAEIEIDQIILTGDVNDDAMVDIIDLASVGRAFGTAMGDPGWSSAPDLNSDDRVDIDDLIISSKTYGTWATWEIIIDETGKSEKVHLTWYIGSLAPCETARLILLVSTDLNPAGHQEYTEPGIYEMNSGATLKFIDPLQDTQLSAVTNSIYVTVLPLEDP